MLPPTTIDPTKPETWPDLTFEEFMQVAELLPCPCPTCLGDNNMSAIEYQVHYAAQVAQAWKLLTEFQEDNSYAPPPTSPTNQEMHATNGNLAQAHSLVEPRHSHHLLQSIRTAASSIPNPLRSAARAVRHQFPRNTPAHSLVRGLTLAGDHADRRFAGQMAQVGGLLSVPAYYTAKEVSDGLADASKYSSTKVSNKDAHISNGNIESTPNLSRRFQNIVDGKRKPAVDKPAASARAPPPAAKRRPLKPWPAQTVGDGLYTGLPPSSPTVMPKAGPTNSDMHSYNGNIDPHPRTKRQVKKTERKRIKNQVKRAVLRSTRTIAKSMPHPKVAKAVTKLDSRETTIASKYLKFLKNPVFQPPRLGSSGNNPTKLVHGYYRKAFNMANPFGSIVNTTCMVVSINPCLFRQAISSTDYASPIVVSVAQGGGDIPQNQNTAGVFSCEDYQNSPALLRQVIGANAYNVANPLGRFVGGSITLDCRCPVTTTAPPFLFGGMIPEYVNDTANPGTVKKDVQLTYFSTNAIRTLPGTVEVPGMSVSSVYIPNTSTSLQFSPYPTRYVDANPRTQVTSVPYVGMTNCPTSAVVEVTVSGWFEVQQNTYFDGVSAVSTADYGGWALGPKVSTEDIFDHLKRFNSVSTRIIGMGAKSSSSYSSFTSLVQAHQKEHTPQLPSLSDEIEALKKQVKHLTLKIDEEEDEKYFDTEATPSLDQQQTPTYKGLSQSTIDLAMSLKKTLTPGSVTNKTVPSYKL